MLLRLAGGDAPLFTQIADAVRGQVIAGAVAAGDRLPAARELAASLGVNLHTVLRAYQDLRDQGLLEMRRGRGAVVTDGAEALRSLSEVAGDFAARASAAGLTADAAAALVRERMNDGRG